MAKCNVPDCKGEAGEMGICDPHLAKYRKGDASIRQYLKPGSDDGRHEQRPSPQVHGSASPQPPVPEKKKLCLVPGCKGVVNCRGICLRHYAALKSKGDVGNEARKYVLAPTRKIAPHKPKADAAQVAGVTALVGLIKNQTPERFSILADAVRDEITIIDKTGDRAYVIKEARTVKVEISQLQ